MNKIAPSVYEKLTPQQRVVAAIEAGAREDSSEIQRLISSCPKKTYKQTDHEFSAAMETLIGLAIAVESDPKECVLGFLTAVTVDPMNSRSFLQNFANIQDAWKNTISTLGIDKKSMALVGPPRSPFFELIEDILPNQRKRRSKN